MEGSRQWDFTSPPFACQRGRAAPEQAAGAKYRPSGWKKRKRRWRQQQGSKRRHEREASGVDSAALAAAPAFVASQLASQALPANPALLAPLRCEWPHPAALALLVQQCWPAAGAAAVGEVASQQSGLPSALLADSQHCWSRMLPSISLLHAPLSAEQQQLLGPGPCSGGSSSSGNSCLQALPLLQPNVLVGYEDDWLEVAADVLPLWQATPLAPFAGPKPLLHYLLCPSQQLQQAQQFIKDVGSLYQTCNLGDHQPAGSSSVLAFQVRGPAAPASGGQGGAGSRSAAEMQHPSALPGYLAGLRQACGQLQRQLLLDPPEELRQAGASLELGAEPAVLVYVVCPLEDQQHQVAALLEAAACLAPCTHLGAAAGASSSLHPLTHPSGGMAGADQLLAPSEPQQPDRPATATPAADSSRAPGASAPPDEGQEEEGGQDMQQEQASEQQQQQYHGAGQGLHQQQRGDYRQLPLSQVARPADNQPVNIVLQVVSSRALADISGTAARCTAMAVYSKLHHVPERRQQVATGVDQAEPGLPFCSQPLMVLAQAAGCAAAESTGQDVQQPSLQQHQQPPWEQGRQLPADSLPGLQYRTLHCCYVLPQPGSTLLPLALTDSCGELLHAELLDTSAASISSLGVGSGTPDSLGVAAPCDSPSTTARACHVVLRRCLEMLSMLRAASSPADVLCSLAIAGSGMTAEEQGAWQQLVEQDPGLLLELPAGGELAVLDLTALPPARYAGPDPPSGCKLLLHPHAVESTGQQATVAWLPPADGGKSLLPLEHDTVRMLNFRLVARCLSDELSGTPSGVRDSLCSLAHELHGLAWLHAAFQGACLQTVAGGQQAAAADAHVPLHAALAARLNSLLASTNQLRAM